MPNWFYTTITLTGPESALTRFKTAHFRDHDDGEQYLDFNTVTPMPEVLKGSECSSAVAHGLCVLGRLDLLGHWSPPSEEKTTLLRHSPNCIEKAEKAIAMHEAAGYIDWYEWACDNWGTKWNSTHLIVLPTNTPGELKFTFATAWGPPSPVIEKLIQLYPELAFKAEGVDEGDNFEKVYHLFPRRNPEHKQRDADAAIAASRVDS
jgi:hypothetical protein